MSVRDIAVRYFECVHAHDAHGLSQLFAEDGWLRPPPPITDELQGREAIRDFYAQLFTSIPDLSIDPDYQLIVDGNVCAARFSSWTNGRHNRGVIDIFTVNERDELVEMIAYSRLSNDPGRSTIMGLSPEDQLALYNLYAVFNNAIDDGDADTFAACFTPDGGFDAGPEERVFGTENLRAFVPYAVNEVPGMRRMVTNIALDGSGDHATGRAHMYSYRAGPSGHEILVTGRYEDTLRKVDGQWRFALRKFTIDTPA